MPNVYTHMHIIISGILKIIQTPGKSTSVGMRLQKLP